MKGFFLGLPVTALMALSGCEVPVMVAAEANDARMSGVTSITMPAKMLLAVEGQPERIYSGTLVGRMSGQGEVDLAAEDGTRCTGAFAADGRGQMNCGGAVLAVDRGRDAKKTMSGADYMEGAIAGVGYRSVFAWGKGANEATLHAAMAARRNLGAKEVRAMN